MADAVVIAGGGGELVGDSPDRRVEILSDDEALNATWSRFGAGREGADLHIHRRHTDLFYVLEGELTVRLGLADRAVTVPAGSLARVPPLVVHGFRNASGSEVRYLNLHAPGRRFADYLRAMRDGRDFTYDQYPPDAEEARPSADAAIGEREVVSDREGLRVELLADVEEIAVAEASGGPAGLPPRHVHRRHVESLYVLEGAVLVETPGRSVVATPGTWVQLPQGVPHAVAPTGDAPARFLDLHTPSCGFGDFARGRAPFDEEPA